MNIVEPPLQTRELLSALADGELRGEAVTTALLDCRQDEVLESWCTYHLIGEVMRQPSQGAPRAHLDFLSRLNERIEREKIVLDEPFSLSPLVPATARPEATPAVEAMGWHAAAANDGNFKWKLLAGFATVAAVSAVVWSAASFSVSPAAPQLARASDVQPVLVPSPMGPMVRDVRLEELILAHRQLGGGSVLQAPSGFLRNAAFEASQEVGR